MPASRTDVDLPSILTGSTAPSALAGINTPIGGLSIAGPGTAGVTVIVTALNGTLYAQTGPGASVSGGGTAALWIAGTVAQVNARLATLVYFAPLANDDTLAVTVVDAAGHTVGPVAVSLPVFPLCQSVSSATDLVTLSGGTLSLDARHLDGVSLDLHDAQTGAGAATVILVDSTLGPNTTVRIDADQPAAPAPRLAIAGNVELDGTVRLTGGAVLVTLAKNAVLANEGRIEFVGSAATVTGAGTLMNDGLISVSAEAQPALTSIDVAVAGSGVISLGAGAQLELGASVGASETIRFEDTTATLALTAPGALQANIAGFTPGDQIQLGAIHTDASEYAPSADGGTLTLYDGSSVAASLHFAGQYQQDQFVLTVATDQGAGGAAISSLSVLPASQLADADDPAAIAVFRFFDASDGCHFFTASVAERDAILASRPDLVFEPNSTLWEHATAQPGDVPVFRFFDTALGTHFYTASASERASILSTRLDLTDEGVAFYAPLH